VPGLPVPLQLLLVVFSLQFKGEQCIHRKQYSLQFNLILILLLLLLFSNQGNQLQHHHELLLVVVGQPGLFDHLRGAFTRQFHGGKFLLCF
jgi:hypothetical protein